MLLPVHQNNCENIIAYSESSSDRYREITDGFLSHGMLLHRHGCVDASETAISINRTKFVFPKASNVGQLHVARSATGTSSCFPPMIHTAEAKHCTRTQNHSEVASQQRAKGKAVLQTEWGISQHTAFSREPRVTSAGTWAAAHRAFLT